MDSDPDLQPLTDADDPADWELVAQSEPDRGSRDPDPLARATDLHFDRIANGEWRCRAYDSTGRLVLTLTGLLDPNRAWGDAFRFAIRGRVLPVRADTHPYYANANDIPQPEPDIQPLGQSVSFRHTKDGTLIDTTYTVSHAHPHDHPGDGGPHSRAYSHAHPHTHDGRDSFRATVYGHTIDPHDHAH